MGGSWGRKGDISGSQGGSVEKLPEGTNVEHVGSPTGVPWWPGESPQGHVPYLS
jgi:hypothetical protein